ncbi:hypothetical protein B0P06_002634 [Clostridium saccharoperbutylacetonicum]|uniref:Polyketide cyclase / dehydrase and lipid transport n=1 Tax=Clostridium saccharoperbutylacetonicum N1-4(HMT) TaxID=931276 RepID=M1MWS4_9CLOT|nr:DUF3284 domain-containing protein [Clostridium saccharoperbutylacetonicum]AGF59031.1 hypothetical protein DUF3284 [Clostridium saccharoperbutylacetonicum N1-4(HMT)]NRT60181.1 hypothetical protein [Clostridium saccharoperbutylacetonicum]NSB23493.1 hypothetical protein [Clostridium saccharoperbutylacetonicum]NSB42863.1 hypothetical protein [Clostridium saccharoperbutylacetonicum]
MASANIKLILNEGIKTVWEVVTSLDNYSWRSDLSKIEILEAEKKFVEYTKEGYATTFTITKFEPMTCYEFDMDNNNMHGHWVGLFSKIDDNRTEINFTENVLTKKWIMKPFVGIYLKKQQAVYISDLEKTLKKNNSNK